jgi:gamma-glutamyltranspeptidase / glutathione hydrolase
MKGVISCGSIDTSKAGMYAFEQGGNAFDAAVAAQLMAFVSEPLLTGFGGAGIAAIRNKNKCSLVDMFTTMPGLEKSKGSNKVDEVYIDFGPTVQRFEIGLGSIAVPTMPKGLAYIHQKFCRLPLDVLIKPALEATRNGIVISSGLRRVLELLNPIYSKSKTMRSWFIKDNEILNIGDKFYPREMEETLLDFAKYGEDLLLTGKYREAIQNQFKYKGLLSLADVEHYKVLERNLESIDIEDIFLVKTPGTPSIGGMLLKKILTCYEELTDSAYSFENIVKLFENQERYFENKEILIPDILSEIDNYQTNKQSSGFTTHLSIVDEEGNAIGITSSLGETSGLMLNNTGIILNNFLGEADVAPEAATKRTGGRLVTMCTPTLLMNKSNNDIIVLGSGGSSRIVSAVLHGIMYLTKYRMTIEQAVSAPRLHLQEGNYHIETDLRTIKCLNQCREKYGSKLKEFSGANMYFGGLNIAGIWNGNLTGHGDIRRSGTSRVWNK